MQEELDPGTAVAMGVPLTGATAHPEPAAVPLLCPIQHCPVPGLLLSTLLPSVFYCCAVALLSPLWVVNATSLAIDAVIVPVEVPQTTAGKQGPGGAQRGRRQALEGLRCAPHLRQLLAAAAARASRRLADRCYLFPASVT